MVRFGVGRYYLNERSTSYPKLDTYTTGRQSDKPLCLLCIIYIIEVQQVLDNARSWRKVRSSAFLSLLHESLHRLIIQLHHGCLEQAQRVVVVFGVDDAGRRVRIAHGDGENDRRDAPSVEVDAPGVGAALIADEDLVGDVFGLGEVEHEVAQPRVGDHGGIEEADLGALSEDALAVVGIAAEEVGRRRSLEHDADVGVDDVGCGPGATEADLLLHCGGTEKGAGKVLQRLHRLDEHGAAAAVVEGLSGEVFAVLHDVEVALGRDPLPGADAHLGGLGRGRGADVDGHVLDVQHLALLGGAEQVRWLAADDARHLALGREDAHPRAGDDVVPPAADGDEAEKPLACDRVHHEADLVGVGRQHDARRRGGALLAEDNAAHAVPDDLGAILELVEENGAHLALVAGHAAGFCQPLEKVE